MRPGLPIVGFMLTATLFVNAQNQNMPAPRTLEEFDAMFTKISNWGRWGKDDELGAANLITDAKRRQAASLVKTGITVSLAHDVIKEATLDNPRPMKHKFNPLTGPIWGASYEQMGEHSATMAHLDAACHVLYKGRMYNGYVASEIISMQDGCQKVDGATHRNGILTRGVLMDIPRLKGLPYLEPGTPIFAEDFEAWERKVGVKVTSGDAVFVRTGRWARRAAKGPWESHKFELGNAGPHPATALWFKARDVAFFGEDVSDGYHPVGALRFEGVPNPLHTLLTTGLGIPFFDVVDLEELANTAERLKRWEFMFMAAPLPVQGSSGSPINPIAVF